MHISLHTASLMSLTYSSALFAQGAPSSRACSVVPIVLQNCLRSGDIVLQPYHKQLPQEHQFP